MSNDPVRLFIFGLGYSATAFVRLMKGRARRHAAATDRDVIVEWGASA